MRTLQEKYNAIQEGKFSKEHFLAEARMQQPQLVTRFNGYDDAVQILKNKGMIVEVSTEESFKDYSNDALTDMIINSSRFEGNEEGIARVKAELERRKQAKLSEVTPAQEKYRVKPSFKQEIAAAKKMIDAGKSEKEVVAKYGQAAFNAVNAQNLGEARLTNKSLTDYRYKPTNDMDKYPYEQILRGIRVELEVLGVSGTPTAEEYSKALAKVSKNLAKDSIFYTNQVAGVNPNVDLHDKMVPVTAKNSVDTFNGMKKAALKEGFKKLIKKVLSETVVDVEDYNGEDEFDMYGDDEADDIPHPRGYEDQDEIDYDDENFSDPFIDGDLDESKMSDVHILAQEAGTLKDFLLSVKAQHPEVDLRRDIEELQHIWNNREQDEVDYDDIDITPDNIGDPGYQGYESPSDRMYNSDAWVQAQQDMMEGKKSLSELLK